ncbi:unnamed protein product [Diamesa hyperborea]
MIFRGLFVTLLVCYLCCVCDAKRCKNKKYSSEESSEEEFKNIEMNCAQDYLKRHDLLETRHSSPSVNNTEDCESQIKETLGKFYEKTIDEMKSDDDLADKAECIAENLKTLKTAELSLKKSVFENSHISKRKRKKIVKSIERQLEGNIAHAMLICFKDTEIGDLFDEIKNTFADDDDNHDYCIREFVLDHNLIDLEAFKVELNPKQLNGTTIESIDCPEVIADLKKAIEGSMHENFKGNAHHISRKQGKCLKKKIKRSGFFGNYLRIVVLIQNQWTPEQIVGERVKFIESTSTLMTDALSC